MSYARATVFYRCFQSVIVDSGFESKFALINYHAIENESE